MAEKRTPRQVFWSLVFIALAALIGYVVSLLLAPGSLLPVVGLAGAAGGLSLWGAWRQYQRRRMAPAVFGALVALLCFALAGLACLELEIPGLTL